MLCEVCGKELDLRPRTIRDRQRLGLPMLCKHCIRSAVTKERWERMSEEDKNELLSKVSAGRTKYFENLTDEGMADRIQRIKNGMNAMTDEARKQRSEKLSKNARDFWDNMSEEEYAHQCQLRKDGWKNMDPVKREAWHQKMIELSKDPERRERNTARQKQFYREHPEMRTFMALKAINQWNSKTDEEKAEYSQMMKNWWLQLTDASYMELQEKVAKGIEKSKNARFTDNKLEQDLAKIFDDSGIKYIRQYATVEMYDTSTDWYKEYSKYSKFVGYRKNWDFYLPDYDIYIDIDGPAHKVAYPCDKNHLGALEHLSKKETYGFSDVQNYYDTRRMLINKRIIILGYDEKYYENNHRKTEFLRLDQGEIYALLSLLDDLNDPQYT